MKVKIFANINLKEGRQPARGLPAFYCIHFFSRRNPSLPYGCTATKRIFDDSAHFYLSRYTRRWKSTDRKSEGVSNFFSKRHLWKLKFFANINLKEGRKSACGFPAFYHIHFFFILHIRIPRAHRPWFRSHRRVFSIWRRFFRMALPRRPRHRWVCCRYAARR